MQVVANSDVEGFVQEAQQQRSPVEEEMVAERVPREEQEGEEEARVVVKETVKIVEKVIVERVAEGTTKIYEGHVRSGQQVSSNEVRVYDEALRILRLLCLLGSSLTPVSQNGSLVIIGNVSSGGEVVADGDIHVYGKLRGR